VPEGDTPSAGSGPPIAVAWDVRLQIDRIPGLRAQVEGWLDQTWAVWSQAEIPVRRAHAIYQKLFRLAERKRNAQFPRPMEFVLGVGMVQWRVGHVDVRHPLLERRVEVETHDTTGEVIVWPTEAASTLASRIFDGIDIPAVREVFEDIEAHLVRVNEEDGGIDPFRRETFVAPCQQVAARFSPGGVWRGERSDRPARPAADDDALVVSDEWALYLRPRSENFRLQDIDRLSAWFQKHPETDIPEAVRRLVVEHEPGARPGWSEDAAEAPSPELYFPKPANDAQRSIVRALDAGHGLVVQGPPGTGKTHTIANIICHAMARGQRVLVVSHGDAALQVLREKLPKGIRELAVALVSSEREGLAQVRLAVQAIETNVNSIDLAGLNRAIAETEERIASLKLRIAGIDAESDAVAARQARPIGPEGETPAEAARRLARERDVHAWFTDHPEGFVAEGAAEVMVRHEVRTARAELGADIDTLDGSLPAVAELPAGPTIAALHSSLIRAAELDARPPDAGITLLAGAPRDDISDLARRLAAIADLHADGPGWVLAQARVPEGVVRESVAGWAEAAQALRVQAQMFLTAPVTVAPDDHRDPMLRQTVSAAGVRARPLGFVARLMAPRALRARLDAIRVAGAVPGAGDWQQVNRWLAWREGFDALAHRWNTMAPRLGAPQLDAAGGDPVGALEAALEPVTLFLELSDPVQRQHLLALTRHLVAGAAPERFLVDARHATDVARAVQAGADREHLSGAVAARTRLVQRFTGSAATIAVRMREFLTLRLGNAAVTHSQIAAEWEEGRSHLARIEALDARRHALGKACAELADLGAPEFAQRLRSQPAGPQNDPVLVEGWERAWDWAVLWGRLGALANRDRMAELAAERRRLEDTLQASFASLVEELTWRNLKQRLSGQVMDALNRYSTAVARIGKGTGKAAGQARRDAQSAMQTCYGAIPCWIMPSYRVAEQLPSEPGIFDLVILDEASQSSVEELPALMRARKVLIVGDDRQVTPTAAFRDQGQITRLRKTFLDGRAYESLLTPDQSIYTLMKSVFPARSVMLTEHFRCVEPIIRFSDQFYPRPLIPLRLPTRQDRLDPPLVDILVPHGVREEGTKINIPEAEVIVDEIAALVEDPAMHGRSIGVVSLIGADQAELISRMVLERIGEDAWLRHRIACGDSATFQGDERDIMFLSMVAAAGVKLAASTTDIYRQRFNVALSRARDRMVLVRSIRPEDVRPNDLKAKVMAHFVNPFMNVAGHVAPPGTLFEQDLAAALRARGWRVSTQVGPPGYRIDIVIEGADGRRLAVECDGDTALSADAWREARARQSVLERVGWRFWRTWECDYRLEPDAVMAALEARLAAEGIAPCGTEEAPPALTLHKVAGPRARAPAGAILDIAPIAASVAAGDIVDVRRADGSIERYRAGDDGAIAAALVGAPLDEELTVEGEAILVLGVAVDPDADGEVDPPA